MIFYLLSFLLLSCQSFSNFVKNPIENPEFLYEVGEFLEFIDDVRNPQATTERKVVADNNNRSPYILKAESPFVKKLSKEDGLTYTFCRLYLGSFEKNHINVNVIFGNARPDELVVYFVEDKESKYYMYSDTWEILWDDDYIDYDISRDNHYNIFYFPILSLDPLSFKNNNSIKFTKHRLSKSQFKNLVEAKVIGFRFNNYRYLLDNKNKEILKDFYELIK